METQEIEYRAKGKTMVGFLAYDDKNKAKRPAILVCHAFEGRNELSCEYAKWISTLGYVGFAVDMFGNKKIEQTLNGCMGEINPFFENRNLVMERLNPAIDAVCSNERVDPTKIGAIGFCFGGMCVLDLARNSNRVKGVVSVHGILTRPEKVSLEKIEAKVLVLQGYKDPQVKKEQIDGFMKEMDQHAKDWQFHFYGDAKHAFTDPKASEIGPKEMGREYNLKAVHRTKKTTQAFFEEVFS